MSNTIKTGFCVAYDWRLLAISLPLIYDFSDQICLSIDKNRKGWSGEDFSFDNSGFQDLIRNIDTQKKISILEENFYRHSRTPMENEVNQRKRMAQMMGQGGWHIQLDCDEYFMNFGDFTAFLRNLKLSKPDLTNICCPMITLFKKTDDGYLIISGSISEKPEFVPVASTNPDYQYGRRNGYFNYLTKYIIIHQSWAHASIEVKTKLKHWGHVNDFNGMDYYKLWDSINAGNFRHFKNFHPIDPELWPNLKLVRVGNIPELMDYYRQNALKIDPVTLWISNSRLISKIKSFLTD